MERFPVITNLEMGTRGWHGGYQSPIVITLDSRCDAGLPRELGYQKRMPGIDEQPHNVQHIHIKESITLCLCEMHSIEILVSPLLCRDGSTG